MRYNPRSRLSQSQVEFRRPAQNNRFERNEDRSRKRAILNRIKKRGEFS